MNTDDKKRLETVMAERLAKKCPTRRYSGEY